MIFQLVKCNIAEKKMRSFLTIFSICVSVLLMLVIISMSSQLSGNIIKNAQFYDVLVGEKGSSTQLVLNTFFFYDTPLGNINYEYYTELKKDHRVNLVVPISMGDNYKGYKIIGTTEDYFSDSILAIDQGSLFKDEGQVAIGYTVAKKTGLKIGDKFSGIHGITSAENNFHEESHDSFKYEVVGILKFSGTPNDIAIFTDIHSVWHVHGLEPTNEAEDHQEVDHEEDSGDHEKNLVTALLVKSKSLGEAFIITQEYDAKTDVQAINPAGTIRKLLESINIGQKIVAFIAGICIVLSIITLFVVMLAAASERNKDVALLRVLGAKRISIFQMVVLETFILSLIGCISGFVLSRLFMLGFAEIMKGEVGLSFSAFSISVSEAVIFLTAIVLCTLAGLLPGMIVYRKEAIDYL